MEIHHSDDDDSIEVYYDEYTSAPIDILVSQEYFNFKDLDIEFDSVKEDVLMQTSSSAHYPLCSNICNAVTCEEYTPCSSRLSSHEFNFQMTQGS